MTKFAKESLVEMIHPSSQVNPYDALVSDGSSLLESEEHLDSLSSHEKTALLTKLILNCPRENLTTFVNLKGKLTSTSEEAFKSHCQETLVLLNNLFGEEPHLHLGRNFNFDLIHAYPNLVAAVFDGKDSYFLSNLRNSPRSSHSAICATLSILAKSPNRELFGPIYTQFRVHAEEMQEQSRLNPAEVPSSLLAPPNAQSSSSHGEDQPRISHDTLSFS
ncbi:hypothetical protein BN59_00425 [Legionella massiliensis]|uniref:Uncharacterized protein n=1 Tax=Legionella massiliensis TaxID=1034943 RepID=A0A078KWN1_9GAMM|nr:hypothetical protein [Legionella massiliensis]CDZ76159.1 hypothetical protein BN59_00425 [Legionella massiliensis]CEE11897.1 hypothetical protein BN1094_00425 [Legionella massiliensis]